jgi:exopolyphosphatase/guanosine-5'-triphosphate,3'-diphosphate pyrophosphatase
MRLGAMLWLKDASDPPGTLRLSPKGKTLELVLHPQAGPLFGEVAESRLKSLAQSLDVAHSVRVKGARRG